jgi:hypothetical protein
VSPTPSDDPCPSPQQVPDRADSPTPPPTTDHHIFAVYQRDTAVSFADAKILHSVAPFPSHTRRPQFEVANGQFIVPIASGFITFPNTDVTVRAYMFRDHDLADNLFGIAPLLRHGYTATFTDNDFALHTSSNVLLYGAYQSPTTQHLAILPTQTDGLSRGGRHPTRTTRRDGPLRLRHVWVTIVSDVFQRGQTWMATQLFQPNPRHGPPQQTTRASLITLSVTSKLLALASGPPEPIRPLRKS